MFVREQACSVESYRPCKADLVELDQIRSLAAWAAWSMAPSAASGAIS